MDEIPAQLITTSPPSLIPESISIPILCPTCHQTVQPTDFFCSNCGTNLHKKPLSTSAMTQVLFYLGSVILFPLGFIWAFRYLRINDPKARLIGGICLVLSIIMSFVLVGITVNIINMVNEQINNQIQNIQGL
jgi:hypothetical protein